MSLNAIVTFLTSGSIVGRPDGEGASVSSERGVSKGRSVGRFFVSLLAVVLILGLGSVVIYLLSDINRRQYRLSTREGMLIVERGRFLPIGFEAFEPEEPDLRSAYAPIPLPPSETLVENEIFSERADLDRVLFSLLAGWARRGLGSTEAKEISLASAYVTRCGTLPGLSEEQRVELRTLRADLAYKNGRRILADIVTQLEKALTEFEVSLELGTSRPSDAERWIQEIRQRMATYAKPRPQKGQQELEGREMEPGPGGVRSIPSPDPVPSPETQEPPPTSDSTPKWRL